MTNVNLDILTSAKKNKSTMNRTQAKRPSGRLHNQLRSVDIQLDYIKHPKGSVLMGYGNTKVLCSATVVDSVPKFLKGSHQGWLTAEYGMLPAATHNRCDREAVRGKQNGRTQEIQRLIGRVLRNSLDLRKLGEYTIYIDCDVIQADGSTRTVAITGGCIALILALRHMQIKKILTTDPFRYYIAAVSVGIYHNTPILDLDYVEDSKADTDMNVVMNEQGHFIELQGTAEKRPFTEEQQKQMLALAKQGIAALIKKQRLALNGEL